jgi:hypothetical protein
VSQAAPRVDALPERGSLDAVALPQLLLDLYRRRFTGGLHLTREAVSKRIGLRDGVPVLAESNLPSESLGIQLLDAGRISREDYARVVAAVRDRHCKEGVALLALDLVAPQELFAALKDQVRRRLLDCFGWSRGGFELDPDAQPAADASAFRCDPIPLAQEGLAIHWSPARIRSSLGSRLDRYPVPSKRLETLASRLYLDPGTERLLAAIDGKTPLGEVLAPAPPSALAAAWVLEAAGAFTWSERPVEVSPDDEGRGPDIEVVVADGRAEVAQRARAARSAQAPARPAKPRAESEGLRARIVELHGKLDSVDHYELLGVDRRADPEAIKRAYFAAAKRFHPDALGRMGLGELRERANAVFARITQGHEVLQDPARRRDYDDSLAGGADVDAVRLVQAEALYRKAEVLLRAGNFGAALEFLAPAVQLWPEEATYQSALGWALYKRQPSDPKAARPHLERAIALEPKDAVSHFRLGLVLRSLGDAAAADRERDLARRLDPKVR